MIRTAKLLSTNVVLGFSIYYTSQSGQTLQYLSSKAPESPHAASFVEKRSSCGSRSGVCSLLGPLLATAPPRPSTVHSFVPTILASFWSLEHSASSPLQATGPLHVYFCPPRMPSCHLFHWLMPLPSAWARRAMIAFTRCPAAPRNQVCPRSPRRVFYQPPASSLSCRAPSCGVLLRWLSLLCTSLLTILPAAPCTGRHGS